ncbi:MAG: cytochrome c-type biogenesis protein CcmH [Gammaproteobacteria bacterium]|nr:cytochrome c-type biogenesis protein CcmH [Gammaproteobacteria bacterium]
MVKDVFVAFAISMLSLVVPIANADIKSYEFAQPQMAQRFSDLTTVLRCPKCQNQNLADSDSIIAKDLRAQIQTLLNDGQSDKQITDFMVQRYGDFILYDPPFNQATLVLWIAPIAMIFIGLWALWFLGRKTAPQGAMLSLDEQQQLQQLLADNPQQQPSNGHDHGKD